MFETVLTYEFEGDFARDDAIREAAGRRANHSGVGMGYRDMMWDCATLEDALAIRSRLAVFDWANVIVREKVTRLGPVTAE